MAHDPLSIIPLNFLYDLLQLMEVDIHTFMHKLQQRDPYTLATYKSIVGVYHYDDAIHTIETLAYEYWSN